MLNTNSTPRVLALTDAITGHTHQTLAIAELLGFPFETMEISYSPFSALPNIITRSSGIGLDASTRLGLKHHDYDIIISTGRRAAQAALYAKRQHSPTKLIHCLWPDVSPTRFKAIILPAHDRRSSRKADNIVVTPITPHRITPEALHEARTKWGVHFAHLPAPHIGVLIGGDSKHGAFADDDYSALLQHAVTHAGDGSLLISASRRTNVAALQDALLGIATPHFVYTPDDDGRNPYLGILACADALMVTADSISMVSEATATQKPVYVFRPKGLSSNKITRFLGHLAANQHIAYGDEENSATSHPAPDAINPLESLKESLSQCLGLDENSNED